MAKDGMVPFGGAGWMDLTPQPKRTGVKFANVDTGQEFMVEVKDRYPQMDDVHVEGRRYVEVSVEMFVIMAERFGFEPVAPEGAVE